MENEYRFLEFEGVQIAVAIEAHNKNEHSEYCPVNLLFYVEQGQLNIRYRNKLYTITKGNFCMVRKLTELSFFKTWDEDEGYAIVKAMGLQDEFINEAIKELGYSIPAKVIRDPVIDLKNNPILMGLHHSLTIYLSENQSPDKHLMYLKTKEALLGIIQSNPDYLALFYEFSKPVKAELREFMKYHSISNFSLSELAKLSGRSLSTFNRDFRKIFNTAPHAWILRKRLHKAKELLLTTNKKSSEIYLDLGFKDLAHFSKSFKKEFSLSPSEIVKKHY